VADHQRQLDALPNERECRQEEELLTAEIQGLEKACTYQDLDMKATLKKQQKTDSEVMPGSVAFVDFYSKRTDVIIGLQPAAVITVSVWTYPCDAHVTVCHLQLVATMLYKSQLATCRMSLCCSGKLLAVCCSLIMWLCSRHRGRYPGAASAVA